MGFGPCITEVDLASTLFHLTDTFDPGKEGKIGFITVLHGNQTLGGASLDILEPPVPDLPALVDHEESITQFSHHVHLVGRELYGGPLRAHLPNHILKKLLIQGGQSRKELIQHL